LAKAPGTNSQAAFTAGVIGLAIASQVAREGREVYVLEKNETFGQEASSRNSEVIHSGIYYPKDSLKAKTCVEGNALLYELC
jgi:L-2-hydroxyglutarate oxidase LhgO